MSTVFQDIADLTHISVALKALHAINPVDSSVIEVEWHNEEVAMLESWKRQLKAHLKDHGVEVP